MENIYSTSVIKSHDDNSQPPSKHMRVCQQTALAESAISYFTHINIPKSYLSPCQFIIETAQKWLTLSGKNGKMHKFPLQTILPKVQMTRNVPRKHLPRDVEVDRRRRQYAKVDLHKQLQEAELNNDELMPTQEQYYLLSENAFKHFLPLSFFDSTDFDCHSAEAWIQLGQVEEGLFPLPAKAYLPNEQSMIDYGWQYAAVSQYDPETHMWTAMSLAEEHTYEVPKIQIMFLAEDPYLFVRRLQKAVEERNRAERVLMMESIVDCVLLQDLTDDRFLVYDKVERLIDRFRDANPIFLRQLRTEVYLVFEHLMACYEFDKFVKLMPKEFPTFGDNLIIDALPRAYKSPESKNEEAMVKSLKLNMKHTRYKVLRTTLYYIAAGIEAMLNVASECQYIETLSIFICSFSKAVPLSDFLQSQQSNSSHVATYLKNFWPQKISSGICLVLRALGKGWLDISLDKWTVYQMCKISRFILQTKFRMQESMQVLLEKSILNFCNFLTEPCKQFLKVQDDYKWPASVYIETGFPYPKPIFSLIISVSEQEEVVYSTAPEEFEPSLGDIFKKALEKTSGVRCIEAETLTNLKFAPNLYIQTVELIEDMYVQWNDVLRLSYKKAIIPLIAYSRLYDRFISFYLLKVNDFMREYEGAMKTSLQVKSDILEHKRQKQELREILPATITIGPFLIHVDPMKQYMIKKHIEIVKRLFEYYVQRMYDINEALLERCIGIYTKISERPQSIEHLYEIRDFGLTVPDQVEQLKADIQIMWLEYDMLDSFFYNLSDHQFAMKWEAYAWPHNIMQRLSTLRDEQKLDIEDFRRIHLSEIIGFEERLESLNEEIQAFSLIFDPNKVVETAVDVKKTWKIIMDLQKLGNTLVYRQALFELPPLSLEFLESIIQGFTPYRTLWSTAADLLKLEEATMGNPIVTVDLNDVWNSVVEIRSLLESSHETFTEKPEIQGVAMHFLEQLDQFVPIYNCIKALKNENWIFLHWQELSARSGMEIKYSAAMNFQYLIRKGIMEHLELVQEISEKADQEADEIRRQMEEEERRKEEEQQALLMRKALRKCRTDIL